MPRTVLVVDDESHVRSLIKSILERQGYRVLEAQDGQEALGICKRLGPTVDLLLTDIVMPVMDGIQLSECASAILPELPILYMSGQCEMDVVRHNIEIKGFEFVRKPFPIDVLVKKIRALIEAPARKKSMKREEPPPDSAVQGRSA